MSFSYETKNELCKLPVQKLCCARAEAYGILLFCNTFSTMEVRIVTENPFFSARIPKLFQRAFGIRFDRQPGDDPLLDILEYHQGLYDLAQKENPQEEFPEVDDYYEMMQEVLADF